MKSFTVCMMLALATTAVLVLILDGVKGDCCHVPYKCTEPDNKKVSRCYDCTEATSYCGVKSCNVFGCNCEGGCRQGNESLWCWNPFFNCGKHAKREVIALPEMQLVAIVQKFDTNDDFALNVEEFAQFIEQTQTDVDVHAEFAKLDVNNDGVISMHEIDPKLF